MIEVNRTTLDNGLKIVHSYDGATAMVAVNVLYGVGARDESPEMTGLAHLFEHLMFGGSVNIPDFDAQIERAGGKNNAWTSNDFTNFYDILPAQNAETAFWLESDRMHSPSFSEKVLQVQKSVVTEEFKQTCLNRPYGNEMHCLRSLAYTHHPYRWPVIGLEPSHIARVNNYHARHFFSTHYGPDNAVLAVSGNISFERVKILADKWFGQLKPVFGRAGAPRNYPVEPIQEAPRLLEVTGPVPSTDIILAYKMDGYGTEQYFAADLLTDLLSNGESSRFYRNLLMHTDIFSGVDASILGSEDPGLLLVAARLRNKGSDAEQEALRAIENQLAELTAGNISEREVRRTVNRLESAKIFENLSYLAKAQTLALAEYHGEDINTQMEPYHHLTPDSLTSHAREIFNPNRCSTLIYRPA